MSDEERREEEIEVEGHGNYSANDELAEDDENDVEAHVKRLRNVRMD